MDQEKVKRIYRELKNLNKQFEANTGWYLAQLIQGTYHPLIDELSEATGEDCSKYKIPHSAHQVMNGTTAIYQRLPTLGHMGMAIGFLEDLLNVTDETPNNDSGVTIINQNTLAVSIQFTISQLIEKATNDEEKEKLIELNEELDKQEKDWDKIKNILIWILNFSKDLFIQILPELLKKI